MSKASEAKTERIMEKYRITTEAERKNFIAFVDAITEAKDKYHLASEDAFAEHMLTTEIGLKIGKKRAEDYIWAIDALIEAQN